MRVVCTRRWSRCYFLWYGRDPDLHSFPTRRSSDLFVPRCALEHAVTFYEWMKQAVRVMNLQVSGYAFRSEEHTSELQSLAYLVCRLLLEKKNALPLCLRTHGHSIRFCCRNRRSMCA